jgi:hypothetical protein
MINPHSIYTPTGSMGPVRGYEDGQPRVLRTRIDTQPHVLHHGSAIRDRYVFHPDDKRNRRGNNGFPTTQEFPRPGSVRRHERHFISAENRDDDWDLTAPIWSVWFPKVGRGASGSR